MAKAEKVTDKGYDTSDVVLTLTSDEAILVNTLLAHTVYRESYISQLGDRLFNSLCNAGVGYLPEGVFERAANRPLLPCIKIGLSEGLHKTEGFKS